MDSPSRQALDSAKPSVRIEKQRDVVYPAYLVYGPSGKAWIEQPSGKRKGWCVHLAGQDVGDPAKAYTLWTGDFQEAKRYAISLVD